MTATRVRGELGPACAKCGITKIWCGTRFLCRPCQASRERSRKAALSAEQREAERVRNNQVRNVRNGKWSAEKQAATKAAVEEWRQRNREAYLEGARRWYRENREIALAQKAAQYEADPASFIARSLKRKARLKEAVCEHGESCVSSSFLAVLYAAPCHYCGGVTTDADHYMPLSKGGLHCRENLVPACGPCNGSKYNHDPIEWMRSRSA